MARRQSLSQGVISGRGLGGWGGQAAHEVRAVFVKNLLREIDKGYEWVEFLELFGGCRTLQRQLRRELFVQLWLGLAILLEPLF